MSSLDITDTLLRGSILVQIFKDFIGILFFLAPTYIIDWLSTKSGDAISWLRVGLCDPVIITNMNVYLYHPDTYNLYPLLCVNILNNNLNPFAPKL